MDTTTVHAAKKSRLKDWLFPTVAAGALASSLVALAVQSDQITEQRAAQDATILELKDRITELSQLRVNAADSALALAAGAPNAELDAALERIAHDEQMIKKLLKVVFTWNSTDTYEQAREQIARVYDLSKDDAFLTTFLPKAPVSVDAEGNKYPYIEAAGLNSSLGAVTVELTLVHGTTYNYLVTAKVHSNSTDGTSMASRVVILQITTDIDGKVTSLNGWSSPTKARSSATG